MMIEKSEWEDLKIRIDERLKELLEKTDEKQKIRFVRLWEKLEPVDEVYYKYCKSGEACYKYYVERYIANRQFQKKIEEVFQKSVYDLDAKSMLEMWRLLEKEEQESSFFKKAVSRFGDHQKNSIQKKLQKHAKQGKMIPFQKVEDYLELLIGQKKRQKQILEAEEHVPPNLLVYFDQHGDKLLEERERYLVLEYCLQHLDFLGFEEEETKFWKLFMLKLATRFPKEVCTEVKNMIQEMTKGEE